MAMPDSYEVAHGLNPKVNDTNLDKDGDGLTNHYEYQLGTKPIIAILMVMVTLTAGSLPMVIIPLMLRVSLVASASGNHFPLFSLFPKDLFYFFYLSNWRYVFFRTKITGTPFFLSFFFKSLSFVTTTFSGGSLVA